MAQAKGFGWSAATVPRVVSEHQPPPVDQGDPEAANTAELRQIRQALGLTQRQFRLAMGRERGGDAPLDPVDAQVRISQYERGAKPVPPLVLTLARLLLQEHELKELLADKETGGGT